LPDLPTLPSLPTEKGDDRNGPVTEDRWAPDPAPHELTIRDEIGHL
jgi:hypothetical protein